MTDTYESIGFDKYGRKLLARVDDVPADEMDAFYELGKNMVKADKIAAGAVKTDKLEAGAVTAEKLESGELITESAQIKDGIITNAKINDLSADKINVGTLVGILIKSSSGLNNIQLSSGDTLDYYYNGGKIGALELVAGGLRLSTHYSSAMDLKLVAGKDVIIFPNSGKIIPLNDNATHLGTVDKAWTEVNSYKYVDLCLWLDGEDDLGILRACQPMKDKDGKIVTDENGKARMDNKSLPNWMQSGENEKGETWRNLGHFVDLVAGAVRQLADKVDKLEGIINKK